MIRITVHLIREKKSLELEVPDNFTVSDLLKKLGYSIQGTVVLRDSTPVIESEKLQNNDVLEIFLTASGG
ncbi:MAG: MoaD/ThiS family protein [Sulfolobaceae archaeon]|nr:MoaD/ThiS family protein [Sulfolobaceae archaeon]